MRKITGEETLGCIGCILYGVYILAIVIILCALVKMAINYLF